MATASSAVPAVRTTSVASPKTRSNGPRWTSTCWMRETGTSTTFRLFDLQADPAEAVNLAGQYPEQVARLQTALDDWRREALAARPALPEPADLDEETLRQLESLGYVGGSRDAKRAP